MKIDYGADARFLLCEDVLMSEAISYPALRQLVANASLHPETCLPTSITDALKEMI